MPTVQGTDHGGGEITAAGTRGSWVIVCAVNVGDEFRVLDRGWHHPQGTGLLTSANTIKIISCRPAQRGPVSKVILNSVKLTVKSSYHNAHMVQNIISSR